MPGSGQAELVHEPSHASGAASDETVRAASSIQAARRGTVARREQKQAAKSAARVQAMHRGRKARAAAREGNLLDLLSGQAARNARKEIETLLQQEAKELDRLIIAHRRVIARRSPAAFLQILHTEYEALEKWSLGCVHRHLRYRSAMLVQARFRSRPFTPAAYLAFSMAIAKKRRSLMRQIAEILELRAETRMQAALFFGLIGPPLVKKRDEAKRRLGELGRTETDPSGKLKRMSEKNPISPQMRGYQERLLAVEKQLKVLENLMIKFKDRNEAKLVKKADGYGSPGTMMREMIKMHRTKPSMNGTSPANRMRNKLTDRWKVAERKQLLSQAVASSVAGSAKTNSAALREEVDLVDTYTQAVLRTQSLLSDLRRGRRVTAATGRAVQVAEIRRRSYISQGIPEDSRMQAQPDKFNIPAENRMQAQSDKPTAARLASRPGGLRPLRSGDSAGVLVATTPVLFPPRTAPAGAPRGNRFRDVGGALDAQPLSAIPNARRSNDGGSWLNAPPLSVTRRPGAASHGAFGRPDTAAGRSALQTGTLDLPPLMTYDHACEDITENEAMGEGTSVIHWASISTESQLKRECAPRLLNSYGTPLPWSPMRYDFPGARWVPTSLPIQSAPPTTPSLEQPRIKPSRSLPALMTATYSAKAPNSALKMLTKF